MRKMWIHALGVASVATLLTGQAHASNLVTVLGKGEASKALESELKSRPSYRALAEDPASASIQLARANPEAVSLETGTVSLDLGSGLNLEVRRVDSYVTESGSLVWSGVILAPGSKGLDFSPLDTLILVRNGDKITGNVQFRGQWFQIRPVGGGHHVVVKVDRSLLPPDHSPFEKEPPTVKMPLLVKMPIPDAGVPGKAAGDTVITVLVNYTAAAAASTGDINGLIDLAVAESNQGYTNSGVTIELQVVKRARVTYSESGSSLTDVNRYSGTSDGFMDYIHTQRNQYGADVGILLVATLDDCGRATNIGSSAATAYAVVRTTNCATGNFTFAHEIGHLQSARHNPEADGNNSPYAYGHGYSFGGTPSFRTIMAVASPITRVNFWSNPNKLFSGVPMGTAARHDNARVLNLTRATVAGFKTAQSCIPDGGFDDTLSQTSCCSGFAVNGSTYCTNPADWYDTWASCTHICGTAPVGGCIPSGGVDDTLSSTSCCSGAAVPGSTFCNDPADYGDDWTTCAQICQ